MQNWMPAWLKIGRNNLWIKDACDPPFDERSFTACGSVDDLIAYFNHGNWSLGQAFYLGDICFIQQVGGGDEWLVIKQDCAFESFTARRMINDQFYSFHRVIEDIQIATLEQCRNLEYSRRYDKGGPETWFPIK
jgi:hypothetical protein